MDNSNDASSEVGKVRAGVIRWQVVLSRYYIEMAQVQFDEDKEFSSAKLSSPKPKTALDSLLKSGIVSNYNQAAVVLFVVATLLFFGAYYVAKDTFPEEPTLGPDVLMPGETVPSSRNI